MAFPPVLLCITIFFQNKWTKFWVSSQLKVSKKLSHYLRVAAVHFPSLDKHFQFGTLTGKNGTGYVSIHHIRMRGFQKKALWTDGIWGNGFHLVIDWKLLSWRKGKMRVVYDVRGSWHKELKWCVLEWQPE